jgi:hypothetical protein
LCCAGCLIVLRREQLMLLIDDVAAPMSGISPNVR